MLTTCPNYVPPHFVATADRVVLTYWWYEMTIFAFFESVFLNCLPQQWRQLAQSGL